MKLDLSKLEFTKKDNLLKTKFPNTLTEQLAYFIGIHIGDGFMNYYKDKNDYRLAYDGHLTNELEWYQNILIPLIKELFNRNVKIQKTSKNTVKIDLHSKSIFVFLHKVCGVGLSPKSNIDVPSIIKKADKKLQKAFLRGLADTDFSLVLKNNGKYPVIDYHTKSNALFMSVLRIITSLDFKVYKNSRLTRRKDKFHEIFYIQINGKRNLDKWMNEIGFYSSNQLTKYWVWKKYGFLPPKTDINQRKAILEGKINIETFIN